MSELAEVRKLFEEVEGMIDFRPVHIPANVNTDSGHREHLDLSTHHEGGFYLNCSRWVKSD